MGGQDPRHVLILPFLDELFPACLVVHVLRDGRDVVASNRRRNGYLAAVAATDRWRRQVQTARAFGGTVGHTRYCEVRYEDLVNAPWQTLRDLLTFLGEEWDDALPGFLDSPHDISPSYWRQHAARCAELRESGAVYRGRVGAHRSELDPVLKMLVGFRSGALLRELGYLEGKAV